MSRGFVQHPDGGLFLIEQDGGRPITAVFGPVNAKEGAAYANPAYTLPVIPKDVAWARAQAWQRPDEARMRAVRDAARRAKRRSTILTHLVGWPVLIIVIGAIAFWIYSAAANAPPATPTPVPLGQLTGAQWLRLSFDDQTLDVQTLQGDRIHCPSSVTTNDLVIGITRVADSPAGQVETVRNILAHLFALSGCVVD